MTARKFIIAAVAALTLGSTAQALEINTVTPLAGPQIAAEMPGEAGHIPWWWFENFAQYYWR